MAQVYVYSGLFAVIFCIPMTQKECWSREIDWYSARHDTIEYHMTTFLRHGEVKGITCNTHALTDKFIADELNRKRVFKQIPVTPSDIIICALFSWKKWMNSGQLIPRFDLSYDGQYWISLAGESEKEHIESRDRKKRRKKV